MLNNITLIYNINKYLQSLYPFGKNKILYLKGNIDDLYQILNKNE